MRTWEEKDTRAPPIDELKMRTSRERARRRAVSLPTTIMTDALSRLPADIWHHIIQRISYSECREMRQEEASFPSDIPSIGLTCRFLADATRQHLFHTVKIHNQARCDGLLQFLKERPHLSSCIRCVFITTKRNRRLEYTPDALWLRSDAGRTLMSHLSLSSEFISTLVLGVLDLPRIDWYNIAYESMALLLASITRLEIALYCTYTTHDLAIFFAHAPKLESLDISTSTLVDYKGDEPMLSVTPSLVEPSSLMTLSLCYMRGDELRQVIDYLRSTGHVRRLRDLTVRCVEACATVISWPLLQDAAASLENVELLLSEHEEDPSEIRILAMDNEALPVIRVPRITSLTLLLGINDVMCSSAMLDMCVALIARLQPSSSSSSLPSSPLLSITLQICLHLGTTNSDVLTQSLVALDEALSSPAYAGLHTLALDIYCQRPYDTAPLSEATIRGAMPRVDGAGKLECKLVNEMVGAKSVPVY
jgi:hypothetical protein